MRHQVLSRILAWLRAGYPEGVPREDYVALFGILHRQLTQDEVLAISAELRMADHHVTQAEVTAVIEEHLHQTATPEDIARVSAVLAGAGWPLAEAPPDPAADSGAVRRTLGGIVAWLRAGYPNGVPERDYIPLMALLSRRLGEEEMEAIADDLVAEGMIPAARADIGVAISRLTQELPSQLDIDRVAAHLREQGWPVELRDAL